VFLLRKISVGDGRVGDLELFDGQIGIRADDEFARLAIVGGGAADPELRGCGGDSAGEGPVSIGIVIVIEVGEEDGSDEGEYEEDGQEERVGERIEAVVFGAAFFEGAEAALFLFWIGVCSLGGMAAAIGHGPAFATGREMVLQYRLERAIILLIDQRFVRLRMSRRAGPRPNPPRLRRRRGLRQMRQDTGRIHCIFIDFQG